MCVHVNSCVLYLILFTSDSMKKLQDQKHDMEREIKILHRKLRVSEELGGHVRIIDMHPLKRVVPLLSVLFIAMENYCCLSEGLTYCEHSGVLC